MKNKIYITWEQYLRDFDRFSKQKNFVKIKNIYGIPRGGLIGAVILSHKLDKPLVRSVEAITSQTLIVDDINDSGQTLKVLFKILPKGVKPKVFTPWIGNETEFESDYYYHIKTEDQWIVMPFESEKTSKLDRINN